MPVTVIIRSADGEQARLTFDGAQRVVIGRGASSDVRLPEASVSHRHASLRGRGAEFVIVDEGSTNGTFVGAVRIAPHTSRLVRSGDVVRVGRLSLELQIDQSPVTRDAALATRDLALALVSRAMRTVGADLTPRIRVVEGRDQGQTLLLVDEERPYLVGRSAECDLALADEDVSREHLGVKRRGQVVLVRDRSAKNGTWLGHARVPYEEDVVWRSPVMIKIGRTVLALEEPLNDVLARIESEPDEPCGFRDPTGAPALLNGASPTGVPSASEGGSESLAGHTPTSPKLDAASRSTMRIGWSLPDVLVMAAAAGVLALSLAGLVWLLRG